MAPCFQGTDSGTYLRRGLAQLLLGQSSSTQLHHYEWVPLHEEPQPRQQTSPGINMREPRFWLYKWNAKGKEGKKFTGLWVDYLKEPLLANVFTGYGFESYNPKIARLYDEVKIGDVMCCFQVDSGCAVGLSIVACKGADTRGRFLKMTAAYRFASPVYLREVKGMVRALTCRLPASLFELSPEETEVVLTTCEPDLRKTVTGKLEEFWTKLEEGYWSNRLPWNETDVDPEEAEYIAAGFGDPARNKEVERAAVEHVLGLLTGEGWQVKSVESEKCGYDLQCVRAGSERHVEVKGVGGSMVGFIITQSELHRARNDPEFALYAVTEALSERRKAHPYTGSELENAFGFRPLQYSAKLKQPPKGSKNTSNQNKK